MYEFPPLITVCKVSYCRTSELTAWVVGVHNNSDISFWSIAMQFAKSVLTFQAKI